MLRATTLIVVMMLLVACQTQTPKSPITSDVKPPEHSKSYLRGYADGQIYDVHTGRMWFSATGANGEMYDHDPEYQQGFDDGYAANQREYHDWELAHPAVPATSDVKPPATLQVKAPEHSETYLRGYADGRIGGQHVGDNGFTAPVADGYLYDHDPEYRQGVDDGYAANQKEYHDWKLAHPDAP